MRRDDGHSVAQQRVTPLNLRWRSESSATTFAFSSLARTSSTTLQDKQRIKQEHQQSIFSFNSSHTETHDGMGGKRFLNGFVVDEASPTLLFLIPRRSYTD